jgi:hypothetical protein
MWLKFTGMLSPVKDLELYWKVEHGVGEWDLLGSFFQNMRGKIQGFHTHVQRYDPMTENSLVTT